MAQVEYPNNLKLYRKLAGYSQVDIAARLGIKNSSEICRWEKGIFFPGLLNLIKLQLLYNASLEFLYPPLFAAAQTELEKTDTKVENN